MEELVKRMNYIIIDEMEDEIYYCESEIEQGFTLDMILEERDRLEIPYHINHEYSGDKDICFISSVKGSVA